MVNHNSEMRPGTYWDQELHVPEANNNIIWVINNLANFLWVDVNLSQLVHSKFTNEDYHNKFHLPKPIINNLCYKKSCQLSVTWCELVIIWATNYTNFLLLNICCQLSATWCQLVHSESENGLINNIIRVMVNVINFLWLDINLYQLAHSDSTTHQQYKLHINLLNLIVRMI
jgi:hypothetical protein